MIDTGKLNNMTQEEKRLMLKHELEMMRMEHHYKMQMMELEHQYKLNMIKKYGGYLGKLFGCN